MTFAIDLTGKVALVTGASQGLGHGFAVALAEQGCDVVLAARQTDKLEALRERIEAGGGRAAVVALDLTDDRSIADCVAAAEQALGPVAILVNNAGVAVDKPMLEQDAADWDRVLDTNLRGAFLMSKAVAQRMIDNGIAGSIINVASVLGFGVIGRLVSYCAAKAGLVHMTKAMALELARHGIRVNAIAPGYIETEMNRAFFSGEAGQRLIRGIPQRRLGQPEDLVGPLLLLASDASRYMTGTAVTVDGGFLLA